MCQKAKPVSRFDLLRFCKSIEFLSAAKTRPDDIPTKPELDYLVLDGIRGKAAAEKW